jgi:hypothetical protein
MSMWPTGDEMLQEAQRATGLDDWGGEACFEAEFRRLFTTLVRSLRDEARLHGRGTAAAQKRLRELLGARLQFVADRKRWPGIAEEQIRRPIVIFGLPRAGSTFLHSLLAQDPANRAPQTWEMMFPSPPPEEASYDDAAEPRVKHAHETLELMGLLEPEIRALHPFGARQHEECHYLMELMTLGDNLTAGWRVPSFNRLRAEMDPMLAFRVHRMGLQTLQFRFRRERWVLKNPGYVFQLARLLATYPDALLVQTHRDPAKVIPSVAALVLAMRRAASTEVMPPEKCAMGNLTAFAQGLEQAIAFRGAAGKEEQFFDVHFTRLVRDPIGTVRELYRHFGIALGAQAESRMRAWLADPANRTPKGKHTLAQYGLDEAMIDRHFERYLQHYRVERERGAA